MRRPFGLSCSGKVFFDRAFSQEGGRWIGRELHSCGSSSRTCSGNSGVVGWITNDVRGSSNCWRNFRPLRLTVISPKMMAEYRTTSTRALILRDDRILVEWFSPKNICFLPGGTVDGEESLNITLERELSEELQGSSFVVGRYLGKIGHRWDTDKGSDSCLNHFFEVSASNPEGISSNEEDRTMRWIDLKSDDLSSLQPPRLRQLLSEMQWDFEWDFVDS